MRLTLMLCDHAAVADGKLYINGGGWNITGPDPVPSGIAALIEVPWDQANRRIDLRIALIHEDGGQVVQHDPGGAAHAVEVSASVEVGRPAGLAPGTPLAVPLAINLPPIPLPPGQGYTWQAELDGRTEEGWRLSFRTRDGAPSGFPASSGPDPTDPTSLPGF